MSSTSITTIDDDRILVLAGAMATMLPSSANPDARVLSDPDTVVRVHDAYLAAGADIITTNTFRSTSLAQEAFGLADRVHALNVAAARLARTAADAWSRRAPDRPRRVAGVIGPLRGSADAMRAAYRAQAQALVEGGVDLILVETVVAGPQAAAAVSGVRDAFDERHAARPLLVSATIDHRGDLPSGETLEAFHAAVCAASPFGVGLNCGIGTEGMRQGLERLARVAKGRLTCHPSAGLPIASGDYPEGPAHTAARLREIAEAGLVDIVGGCCGTTPAHIRAIADAVRGICPRHALARRSD